MNTELLKKVKRRSIHCSIWLCMKEEPTITPFRVHLVVVTGTAAEKASVRDALYSSYIGHSRLNRLDAHDRYGSSCISFDPPIRVTNCSKV